MAPSRSGTLTTVGIKRDDEAGIQLRQGDILAVTVDCLPWHAALHWLDAPKSLLTLMVDLAPTDRIADALVARRIMQILDPVRRTPALQVMGLARIVGALRRRPVQEDDCGRLLCFRRPEAPTLFVAVRDCMVNADGHTIAYRICVPPHMTTAREAVAWTFGMSQQACAPEQET